MQVQSKWFSEGKQCPSKKWYRYITCPTKLTETQPYKLHTSPTFTTPSLLLQLRTALKARETSSVLCNRQLLAGILQEKKGVHAIGGCRLIFPWRAQSVTWYRSSMRWMSEWQAIPDGLLILRRLQSTENLRIQKMGKSDSFLRYIDPIHWAPALHFEKQFPLHYYSPLILHWYNGVNVLSNNNCTQSSKGKAPWAYYRNHIYTSTFSSGDP